MAFFRFEDFEVANNQFSLGLNDFNASQLSYCHGDHKNVENIDHYLIGMFLNLINYQSKKSVKYVLTP